MVQRPGANSPEPGSTTRATASAAQRPGTLSSPLRISHAVPTLTMRLPAREYVASLAWFRRITPSRWTTRVACTAGQAEVGWRSIGRSPTAISLKNNGGGHHRGRPRLVGRAMTVTDNAAALFFRAVARDRHPTPACTASAMLRGYERRAKVWNAISAGFSRSCCPGCQDPPSAPSVRRRRRRCRL